MCNSWHKPQQSCYIVKCLQSNWDWEYNFTLSLEPKIQKIGRNLTVQIIPGGTFPDSLALACFVQHNKHERLLTSDYAAGHVADSTENKFGPSL